MGHTLSQELRKEADEWPSFLDPQFPVLFRRAADALDEMQAKVTWEVEVRSTEAERDELRRQLDVANLWASDLPSREWFDEQVARAERAEAIAREQTKFAQRAYEEKGAAEAQRDEIRDLHAAEKSRADRAVAQAVRFWRALSIIAHSNEHPMEFIDIAKRALREPETDETPTT